MPLIKAAHYRAYAAASLANAEAAVDRKSRDVHLAGLGSAWLIFILG